MSKIRTALKVDVNTPAAKQPYLHNRWHPDVPFCGKIHNNETVKIECLDWTGGQIGNNDSADDVLNVDLTKVHYLSGPFEIEGAEPGDVLCVEIQDVQPFEDQPWGFSGVFHRENGGGFLDEIYPNAAKAIWDFEGIHCTSRHIPGVKFAGLIHPGILGCAPSAEILAEWNRREAELISEKAADGKTTRTVANPPLTTNTHAGAADETAAAKIAAEEGDGEISFCGAIEMAGVITVKCTVMKDGQKQLGMVNGKSPIFIPGPVQPQFGPGRMLYFEGFSVDENGKQHFLDATVAYRQSCLRIIEYLKRYGYDDYQIYLLLSAAPVEGHIAGIVDIPNACTTIGLPMDIFEMDIRPETPAKKLDMARAPVSVK
ncbi:Acetamidase/Formamidase [Penicillium occitanis (nom. inval.)]|nr:Acetamidase/Formamidase [Penicillium occitanis (nom. inval.)]PCG99447.1 hypothetical protein PENOC_058010 [Penicillium occitanis (nom. inval.)]